MSLIVCSPSTQNFLEGEKFIVNNPPTKNILQLQGTFNDVIAVGGGAVIDTAKILSSNPITCYPTTAAGATATSHSVYWDGTKYDAISHCLDVIWSKDIDKLDKVEVENTLSKLANSKTKPIDVIKLGHKAGTFIQKVPTTILHALSYPITGKYGITHGRALGFLIPPLCKLFNLKLDIKKCSIPLDIDIDFIINKAQTYPKFFNTKKQINLKELTKLLKHETI